MYLKGVNPNICRESCFCFVFPFLKHRPSWLEHYSSSLNSILVHLLLLVCPHLINYHGIRAIEVGSLKLLLSPGEIFSFVFSEGIVSVVFVYFWTWKVKDTTVKSGLMRLKRGVKCDSFSPYWKAHFCISHTRGEV